MIAPPKLNEGDTISRELINWISLVANQLPVVIGGFTISGTAISPTVQSPGGLRRPAWLLTRSSGITTVDGFGFTPTGAGAIASANTGVYAQAIKSGNPSAGVAGSSSTFTSVGPNFWRGNASGLGGFYLAFTVGVHVYQTTGRFFFGLTSGAAPGNVDPSTLTDVLLFGNDSADTNFQIMTNDSAGTCTKVDLGSGFPCNTSATDLYMVQFYCAANASTINYAVSRLNTGTSTSGTLSSDLMTSTTFRQFAGFINNGTTAAACQLAFCNAYAETLA